MAVTLDLLCWLLKTNLTALRCTHSSFLMSVWWWGSHTGLAYSTSGRTRVLYACSLIDIDEIFRFLRMKPRVLFALFVMESMCWLQFTLSPWTGLELANLVVIGTNCTCSCKSNYHTITTAPRLEQHLFLIKSLITILVVSCMSIITISIKVFRCLLCIPFWSSRCIWYYFFHSNVTIFFIDPQIICPVWLNDLVLIIFCRRVLFLIFSVVDFNGEVKVRRIWSVSIPSILYFKLIWIEEL
jgi:hypothetical protein